MIEVIDKIYLTLRLVLMNRKYLVSSSNAHQMHLNIQNFKFLCCTTCVKITFFEWILP